MPERAMTAALAQLVDRIDLPSEGGVSVRTCRSVLRTLARIAGPDGEFRWGCRVAKLATLCEVSASTIKRAEAFLVRHGFIERAQVGGGRASTRWRILIERLHGQPESDSAPRQRPASPPSTNPQLAPREPAQEQRPLARQIAQPARSPVGMSPPVHDECAHGFSAELLPSGLPRCPLCRRSGAARSSSTGGVP